uniref:Uncharacterized protein n=1 Tax=Cacopsylla melanoneura TaxID=428564 RepID=A0A8D9BIQ8_9HEMI
MSFFLPIFEFASDSSDNLLDVLQLEGLQLLYSTKRNFQKSQPFEISKVLEPHNIVDHLDCRKHILDVFFLWRRCEPAFGGKRECCTAKILICIIRAPYKFFLKNS